MNMLETPVVPVRYRYVNVGIPGWMAADPSPRAGAGEPCARRERPSGGVGTQRKVGRAGPVPAPFVSRRVAPQRCGKETRVNLACG